MKKLIITLALLLAIFINVQADQFYGPHISTFTLDNEWQGTNFAAIYESDEEALPIFAYASIGQIVRVGNASFISREFGPVDDVRMVAIDGVVVCYSQSEFGCNGY